MLLLVSGEGPSDMGRCLGADSCQGGRFEPGPMAWIVDRIVAPKLGQSLVAAGLVRFISERTLNEKASTLRPKSLPGKKRKQETAFFYRTARALAQTAVELAAQSGDDIIAVLFRDADGSQSAGRGQWQEKWESMLNGFSVEGIATGVPMLPQPKSEAWLLCALKANAPYQHCARIECESGNDRSPNSLKKQLKAELGEEPTSVLLADKVRSGAVDALRIDMPSFAAFRQRLEVILEKPAENPSGSASAHDGNIKA